MQYIEYILFAYFAFAILYAFVLSAAGKLRNRKIRGTKGLNKIAVLIPAYKEDGVIVSVARKALEQQYPANYFDVVVIADQLQKETIENLRQLPITLVKVNFKKSTKTKSLNAAMAEIEDDYDLAVVLDADNVMQPDFLAKVSQAYNAGHKVIQGRRVAKNMNTNFAILDALSEIINNHIYRKGHFSLGLSCSLIGSGMAFDYRLFKRTLLQMDSIGGFDRELEYRLLALGHKAVYLEDAMVYDEKVDRPETFKNQRKRWISSQFVYLRQYFLKGFKYLVMGEFSYFNSTVLRNMLLPRILVLGFTGIFALLATVFYAYVTVSPLLWWGLLALNFAAFALAVPSKFYTPQFWKALAELPKAFGIMAALLFRLKGANKSFIHTPHSHAEVQPTLKHLNVF